MFRAGHGYRWRVKIPKEELGIIHELYLSEHASKQEPSPKDRSKKITYRIPDVGTVVINHATGTTIIDSYHKDALKRLKRYLPEKAYREIQETKMLISQGIHVPKGTGKTYTFRIPVLLNLRDLDDLSLMVLQFGT